MKKTNLILIFVLAILAAFFFLDTQRQETQREIEERERQILAFDSAEIASITLEKPGENPIQAERDGESWRLAQPVDYPGDQAAWDNIVNSVGGGQRQQIIDVEPVDPSLYGLDAPRVTVRFQSQDSDETATLAFGNETPISGQYYALIAESGEVATVRASLFNAVNRSLFDLRDKTVLTLQTDSVQRVEVKSQKVDYTVERYGDDQWMLTEPVQARAEEASVRGLISAIRNAKIQQFIDDAPDMPEAYGLVEPATRLTFWVGDANNPAELAARALLIGATTPAEQLYVKRGGQENVFTIDPRDLNALPTRVEELRKKTLTPLRSWNVLSLSARHAGEQILSVSKDSGDWFMQYPHREMIDFTRTSEIVRQVVGLEAEEFVEGELEDYGLDAPDVIIELADNESSEIIALAAHVFDDGSESVKVYYGARHDPLEIYRVDAFAVDHLVESLQALAAGEPAPITPAQAPDLDDSSFVFPSDDDLGEWEGWNFIDQAGEEEGLLPVLPDPDN